MSIAKWRIMLSGPSEGPWNMAVDETLMQHARMTGECVLRVYSWTRPTLSFGRNQTARRVYDPARINQYGIDCVRRPTGGRAVLHHREVTYSVAAPEHGYGSLRESYERINHILLHALQSLGVAATASSGSGKAISPGPSPCFDQPVKGELEVEGRKLVGSAQWRERDALLQHGSILTEDDQSLIRQLLLIENESNSTPATLTQVMGRQPEWTEVAEALHDALMEVEDANAERLQVDDLPQRELQDAHARYLDHVWTWRR